MQWSSSESVCACPKPALIPPVYGSSCLLVVPSVTSATAATAASGIGTGLVPYWSLLPSLAPAANLQLNEDFWRDRPPATSSLHLPFSPPNNSPDTNPIPSSFLFTPLIHSSHLFPSTSSSFFHHRRRILQLHLHRLALMSEGV